MAPPSPDSAARLRISSAGNEAKNFKVLARLTPNCTATLTLIGEGSIMVSFAPFERSIRHPDKGLHRTTHPVFLADLRANSGRTAAHLFARGGPDRIGQGIFGQPLGRDRRWTGAELKDALSPERLISKHRCDNRG
jgi:hypothetical protein